MRIGGLVRLYPNIRRVPEKILDMEFVAFSKKTNIRTPDWKSLRPYDVGIIRGWKIFESNVTGTRSLTRVKNVDQLFELLVNNRAEVILLEKWIGLHIIKSKGLKGINLLGPPLAVRNMFMYLHKRHAAMIPKISAALRDMKSDGTYANIFNKSLGPLARR